ncbi:MAG: hypothetical protein WAN48_06080 [Actinomycetes bacterium]
MVVAVVRSYWDVANGLTDVTRQRAAATARSLWSGEGIEAMVPGALGQVQSLTDELVALSRSNRDLLASLVSAEVDRALGAMGLATRDEVTALRRTVERLSASVQQLRDAQATPQRTPAAKSATKPATKPVAKSAAKPATKPSHPSTKGAS